MPNLSDITALRQLERETKLAHSLTTKRKEFEQRKREEWRAIKESHDEGAVEIEIAAIRQRMANIMLELKEQGVTKKQLGEAYGSKDARTINELLDSGVLESSIASTNLYETEENTWVFSFTNYRGYSGEVTVCEDGDGDVTILDLPAHLQGTELHREIIGGLIGDFTTLWENRG